MATKSVQAIPEDKRIELAIHSYAMDGETACTLHKVDGILELIRAALDGIHTNDPVPDGVDAAIWAAHEILQAAMVRGGIRTEVQS